ncbi:hypothetical protein ACLB2K_013666 [Fragaria x ananassa]
MKHIPILKGNPSPIPNPTPPYSSPPSPLPTAALLPPSLPSPSKPSPLVPIKPPSVLVSANDTSSGIVLSPSLDYSSSTSIKADAIIEAELRENGFRTKLICTIGPASVGSDQLEVLAAGRMNVARLNMCHDTCDWHRDATPRDERVRAELGGAGPVGFDTLGLDDTGPLVFPETRARRRCCRCGSDGAVLPNQWFSPWVGGDAADLSPSRAQRIQHWRVPRRL